MTEKQDQRLIPLLVSVIRRKGYSYSTEKNYSRWVKRFIRFHDYRHPIELGEKDIVRFLSDLAVTHNVSSSTQNQALNALVFLYRQVLEKEIGDVSKYCRAKSAELDPVVLSASEVKAVLERLEGVPHLMVSIIYGCGLRLKECLRLRVKDIDFERRQICVRQSKGKKDRSLPLPDSLLIPLRQQLEVTWSYHQQDLLDGFGEVYLPYALSKKYPEAARDWKWKYVFPSVKRSRDPRSQKMRRHHLHDSYLISHVRKAATAAGIQKKITIHSFRHSYATHMLENNRDIRLIQQRLGHRDLKTTMRYTHVANSGEYHRYSPLDEIKSDSCSLQKDKPGRLSVINSPGRRFRLEYFLKFFGWKWPPHQRHA